MLPINFIVLALIAVSVFCGFFVLKAIDAKALDPKENHAKLKQIKLTVIWLMAMLTSTFGFLLVFFTTFNYFWMFIFGFSAFICGTQAAQRERQASML